MNEGLDDSVLSRKVRTLDTAMRRVRAATAQTDDVIVDMQEAERARLDLLSQTLENIATEIPEDDNRFEFVVSLGEKPRFWVDMTTQVIMGRDKRTYRLIKDTRLGRTVLGETLDLETMADYVTDYVAERLLDRERALEAEYVLSWAMRHKAMTIQSEEPLEEVAAKARGNQSSKPVKKLRFYKGLFIFLLGALSAVVGLLGSAYFFTAH